MLQQALNPPREDKGERRFGDWVFRAGDKVMQVRNNYDILWREEGGTSSGMGMFNGDIGVIRSIQGEIITVDFDGKVVEYTPDMLGELEPAFAVTVHKAQGSEYRAVILAALEGAPMLMTRGVLYTAITRARELFIIVGDQGTVAQMVANDRQTRRYSGLRAGWRKGAGQGMNKAAALFQGWPETMVWSCLQGCMGQVLVEGGEEPASAAALIGDFAFSPAARTGRLPRKRKRLSWSPETRDGPACWRRSGGRRLYPGPGTPQRRTQAPFAGPSWRAMPIRRRDLNCGRWTALSIHRP